MKQNTIKNIISFSGIGLHSGVKVNITLKPALANTGIIFRRADINNDNNKVEAKYDKVINTHLGTTIGNNNRIQQFISNLFLKLGIVKDYGVYIRTIEHLMASLWSCNIDNIIIEIDNKEVPIMDGSAYDFVEEIQKARIVKQNEDRKYLVVKKEIDIIEDDRYIRLIPFDGYKIDLTVDFKYGGIGRQSYSFNGDQESFIEEIAKARTFCNLKEVAFMKKRNLALGGSEKNAMIFNDKTILNQDGFRCDLEPVRHKLLDCIGDMYTSGYFMKCKIEALKTGHTMNNKLLYKLFSDTSNYDIV